MKYSSVVYAEAFVDVINKTSKNEEATTLKNFLDVIRKNGDWPGINKIIDAVTEAVVKQAGGRMIKLEFARTVSESLISNFLGAFLPGNHIEIKINPQLVAGIRVTIDGEREFDNSLERKLNRLFS